MLMSVQGQVALIIGTSESGPAVEVFSPDGNCQHQLASIPALVTSWSYPTIAYIGGNILSYGGDKSVSYTICYPSQSEMSKASFT